jgi:hypothetical protein
MHWGKISQTSPDDDAEVVAIFLRSSRYSKADKKSDKAGWLLQTGEAKVKVGWARVIPR